MAEESVDITVGSKDDVSWNKGPQVEVLTSLLSVTRSSTARAFCERVLTNFKVRH
jgi:hypothetical protein